jgi:hypothetical protein
MVGRNGLRVAGGTQITKCCGREAIMPADGSMDYEYVLDTEDGTPITDEEFGDADLVCPGCERTWPQDCEHEHVTLVHPSNPEISDGSRWFTGECQDCNQSVNVLVEVGDVRVTDDG